MRIYQYKLLKINTLIALQLLLSISLYAQKDTFDIPYIQLKGQVVDTVRGDNTFQLMIVNKNTGIGYTAHWNGKFDLRIKKSDTLLFAAAGYHVVKLCLSDSVSYIKDDEFYLQLYIQPLHIELASVEIKPMRSLQELKKERQNMKPDDPRTLKNTVSMLESPITALYEFFSQREQSKRLVAEMEYEDKKRDYLKELFKLYVDYDVIALRGHEFDTFINYLNISDEMLRHATDIELIEYIQIRYKNFKREYDYFFED